MGCGRLYRTVVAARTLGSGGRLAAGLGALGALAALGAPAGVRAQQATGTITGRVTDAGGGTPLAGATIRVVGTANGAQTAADGRYTIRGVATGTVTLQVSRIGYTARTVTVAVTAGQPATADVAINQAALSLSAVVTTVTGEQKKAEISNTVASIAVADRIAETPVATLGQVLSGRAAGVQVISAGATGAGSRVRIRGQSSLSLANEPLVYIDGVRVTSTTGAGANTAQAGIGVGGSAASRLDDINPEEIESIDVIKGPSAATLYGTEAANGVINITTKRGRAGRTRWTLYTENGLLDDPNKGSYPDLFFLWGTNTNPAQSQAPRQCVLSQVASGACRADSLFRFNALNNPSTTPLADGNRSQYGLQASGGSERTQFFVSAERERETGPYRMPAAEVRRLETERGRAVPIEQLRPNAMARVNLRTNLTTQVTPKADFNLSVGYVNSEIRLPQNEDNGNGLMVAAIGGLARTDLRDGRGVALNGYRSFPMGDVLSQTTSQSINRFINSFNARWYPVSWLNTRANLGFDYTSRNDAYLNRFDEGPFQQPLRSGRTESNRGEIAQYTVDVGATGTFTLLSKLTSKTSTGVQWFRNYSSRTYGTGENLPPGAVQLTAAAIRLSTQATDEAITLGTYVEQILTWDDRIFLTGGLRYDGNSAFGSDFKGVFFPKVGLSWVASQESWFPSGDWVNSFRLRGTYGSSGVQPGTTDALRFLSAVGTTLTGQVEAPGVTIGALGNANLRPEYSGEFETGFDATLFGERTSLELTYYNKTTRDAIIRRTVAGSIAGVADNFENIGSIRNEGFELSFNQRLLDRRWAGLDLNVTGSTNRNRILSIGGVAPIFTGNRSTQWNRVGYPLFSMWQRRYTFADANGDGIIAPAELSLSPDTSFIGPSFPTRELAVSPRLELFGRKLAVSAQFDYKGGMMKLNNTLRHQCQGGQACRGLYDRTAPLAMQAAALAANQFGVFSGIMENGDFTRFRELAVSYQLPDRLTTRLRASRLALVLTGRNLAVWTPYSGVDPEASVGNGDQRGNEEFFSTPPLRYFTGRLNVSF